ncbi:MAG: hypothetical protein Q4B48_03905 [Syntrophomonadaceae bacterium]|nr:hypothetical protein [Syntrophomonadaceae bacterium]
MAWFMTILEVCLNFFDSAFYLLILTFQLRRKETAQTKHMLLFGFVLAISTIIFNQLTFYSATVMVLALIFIIVFSFAFLQGHNIMKVFWPIALTTLVFCIELGAVYAVMQFNEGVDFRDFAAYNNYRLYAIAIAKSIEIVVLVLLTRVKLEVPKHNNRWLFDVTLAITSALLLLIFSAFSELLLDDDTTHPILTLITFAFIIINAWIIVMMAIQSREYKKYLNQQLEKQIRMQKQQLIDYSHNQYEVSNALITQYIANVNEALQVLWGLMKNGNVKQFDKYMEQIALINLQLHSIKRTGCQLVDMALLSAEGKANSDSIVMQYDMDGFDLERLPIEESDLYIILNTVLDKAIRSVGEEIAEGYRSVMLTMHTGECLELSVLNMTTDKRCDYSDSGLDLRLVDEIVKRAGGTFDFSHDNYCYSAQIIIPQKKKHEKDYGPGAGGRKAPAAGSGRESARSC